MSRSGMARGSVHFLRGAGEGESTCAHCGARFELRYAYQQVALRSEQAHVCSRECRAALLEGVERAAARTRREPIRIAVLNQKGGTGKTTTAVNLASGLADEGKRVLLMDCDAQGHVGISLGMKGQHSLYHVIVEGRDPLECIAPVTEHLHLLTSNELLASAEIYLARRDEGRDRILRERMSAVRDYDYIILDCGPSLSLLNMNALTYADQLLVPVSCDFLSLIGVRQIMKTVAQVNRLLLHPVRILGVLPTFYDQRNKISNESIASLKSHFKDRVLSPIRVNTRLKEAPSHKKSIFEYAPYSRGAADYRRLVRWVLKETETEHGRSDAAKDAAG